MHPVLRESLLKGVFLGVWAYLALSVPPADVFARVVAWAAGGAALGLLAGAVLQLRRGYRPGQNPLGFALLTVLDSAYFVYLGTVGAAAGAAFVHTDPPADFPQLLPACAVAGGVLGLVLHQLRGVSGRPYRLVLGLVLGVLLSVAALYYVPMLPALAGAAGQRQFALYLLAGLPFFALLVVCGESEESEAEAAALFAGLGIGLYLLKLESKLPEQFDKLVFLAPLLLYVGYATNVLPRSRVFKHTLRGYAHLSVGRPGLSLAHFARALQLDRRNELAAAGLARLVRTADLAALDADTQALLPVGFCLDLAEDSLVRRTPTAKERADAARLLDVAERQRPALAPRVAYLRAVLHTHAGDYDAAAATLSGLLDPGGVLAEPDRAAARSLIAYPAWDLALRLHPELRSRMGENEVAKPGRRIDALRAVEKHLTAFPEDPAGVELKRGLYAGLTEPELVAANAPPDLNYDYVEQLGQSLLGASDPADADRGMSFLRMAGRGLPARAPVLFKQLADVAHARGHADEATGYLGQVKRAGLETGPDKLPADGKAAYLSAVRTLAAGAEARGDYRTAVDDYRLAVEAGEVTPDTLRRLADLYARAGDPLNAALVAERGLLYAKADPDLLAKKESYYYSIPIERAAAVRAQIAPWFDAAHCVTTAGRVADQKEADSDALDYGLHLARLARAVKPDSQAAMLAEARLLLRSGDRDGGLKLLEDLREQPRGRGEDEDAWFVGTRILGEMYLDELGRPDLAVGCFHDYRDYARSGADTLYLLGRAHEAAGNIPAAIRAFDAVAAFTSHPRYTDALEAARRLREGQQGA